jgi:hypothetical protein
MVIDIFQLESNELLSDLYKSEPKREKLMKTILLL